MMNTSDTVRHSGTFRVGSNRRIYGELTLKRGASLIELTSDAFFDVHRLRANTLHGSLLDLTDVSLLHCTVRESFGSRTRGERRRHTASLLPDFAVLGTGHIWPNVRNIVSARFVIDEAKTLFHDFDAFGSVLSPKRYIRRIANANFEATRRRVRTGEDPQILYFAGRREIFSSKTVIGQVSATHNPGLSFTNRDGVSLSNNISINTDFTPPVAFDEAISRILVVLRYMELIVGRPQNVTRLSIETQVAGHDRATFDVFWNWAPARNHIGEGRPSHPADVLIHAVEKPAVFGRILGKWLSKEVSRNLARIRFSQAFEGQSYYTVDRLVGAANMFDILPKDAVSPTPSLSAGLQEAKKTSEGLFRRLPQSGARDSALDGLGRIGRASLRHKIESRAQLILDKIGNHLPDVNVVIREAVACRNYFVHGTIPTIDYASAGNPMSFLTDALEFIFGASELVEAGWDVAEWADSSTTMAHPYARFRITYANNLERLKAAIAEGHSKKAEQRIRARRASNAARSPH